MAVVNIARPSRFTEVFVNTGEPIEEDDLLEFRLLYQGELLPSGNSKTRPGEKHKIRRGLHPQLRRLWHVHDNLRAFAIGAAKNEVPGLSEAEVFQTGIETIGRQYSRAGYYFVPLVAKEYALRCSLDILLLRPEEDRFIFTRGDIDGQIKTLFDALRLPDNADETDGDGPGPDEDPFFCLLTDDKLISAIQVTTDQLLMLPQQREVKANDCFVSIHVKINHKFPGAFDQYFA
jgi:hypothetical protein